MQNLMLGMYNILRFITNPVGYALNLSANNQLKTADTPSPPPSDPNEVLKEGAVKTFQDIYNAVNLIVRKIVGPVFSIISTALVIMVIKIGFEYAKAPEASEREKKKNQLIGMIVGAVIMITGAVLCFSVNWAYIFADMDGSGHVFKDSSLDNDEVCDLCGLVNTDPIHK